MFCFFFLTKINVTGRDRAHSSGDHFSHSAACFLSFSGKTNDELQRTSPLLPLAWESGGGGLVLKVSLNGLFSNLTGVVWCVCFSAVS